MRPLLSALILSCCIWPPLQAQSNPPPAESQPAPQSTAAPSSGTEPTIADQQKAPEPQPKAAEGNSVVQDQPAAGAAVATLGADGKRIEPPPCARKDKECARKRKSLLHRKDIGMKVANGTLTVDGWTSKAHLNYDIHDVKFLYVSIPGTGTVIASMEQFPNSIEQKNALDGKTLTLKTPDDHIVQLSSDEALVDKKEHVFYVLLDKTYVQPGRFPTMGYGTIAQAPYAWPSARPMNAGGQKFSASAPPLPPGLQAKQVQLPCQQVAPGQKPMPVNVNGVTLTPEACKTPTPAASPAVTPPAQTPAMSAVSGAATPGSLQ